MLYIALAFFVGDACLQWLPALPSVHDAQVYGLPSLVLLVAVLGWGTRFAMLRHTLLAGVLSFAWAGAHGMWQLQQDLDPTLEGRDLTVIGYVDSIPEHEAYGLRFSFVVETVVEQVRLPKRIELSWYSHTQQLHAAERWQLQVRLKRRHGFANPGGMDYEGQLFIKGIGATGYVRDAPNNHLLGIETGEAVLKVRAALAERISAAIPHAPLQGVVRGLAIGDQQAIDSTQWRVFARTGISHLIAISGSHIGMVGLLAAWLGGGLARWSLAQRRRLTRPDLRALFGWSAAAGYSLLAGMSIPTQRTLVMLSVYFATQWWRRDANVWHSFGLALLLCVLIDPFAPLAIGTWLSFGAVAVILLNEHGRVRRAVWWREFLNVQIVVSIGLIPLLIAAFGNVSLIAPLVNLIAIPLFTLILVPAVLLSCALLVIHAPLGTWCLQWVSLLLDRIYAALAWAADLPLAIWYLPQASSWALLLLGFGALIAVLPLLWPMRVCGLLCCLPALLWRAEVPPTNSFELTALDVGQGLAVVIRTPAHTLLYDAGPKFQSGSDTGMLAVLPYLRAVGVRRIDMMMISHGDADHVGGAASVVAGMPVTTVLAGPSVVALGTAQVCQRGQHWQWDGIDFEVPHPAANDSTARDNDTSCVLRISGPGGSALLLGDIEQNVERRLVAEQRVPATELVIAGHHGSRSSSTQALVDALHAKQVIFSAGYRNRWGFPRAEVVARWRGAGARTDTTSESGALRVMVGPMGLSAPLAYRDTRKRYWQAR